MRVAWELLLGLFIINLAVGLVIGLALPGTAYVSSPTSINATDYESHFNATEMTQAWDQTPLSGVPIIGDIYAGFNFLFSNIQYLVDGLPTFLNWIKTSYITDSTAQTAFDLIGWTLRGIYAFLFSMFVVQFISGRYFE